MLSNGKTAMFNRKKILYSFVIAVSILGASIANASEAYTTSSAWLRTGPDRSFPTIMRVQRSSTVDVIGCTSGYRWCDVEVNGERGWLQSNQLQMVYNGRRGSLSRLGPLMDLMILQFNFGDYWDNHYRSRPWYNDQNRQRWQNWQPNMSPFHTR